jgi:hypothetical protein
LEKILKFFGKFSYRFRIIYWVYTDGKYCWGINTYVKDISNFPSLQRYYNNKMQDEFFKERDDPTWFKVVDKGKKF